MTTPTPAPSAHAIKDTPPVFPCWLWHDADNWKEWLKFRTIPTSVIGLGWDNCDYTHWHPDQPEAPTSRPEQPAVKPPAVEGTEWAKRAAREHIGELPQDSDYEDRLHHQYDIDDLTAIILKHAPSQPRQAGLEGLREAVRNLDQAILAHMGSDFEKAIDDGSCDHAEYTPSLEDIVFSIRETRKCLAALTPPPVAEPSASPGATEQAVEKCAGIGNELCLPVCTPDWVKALRTRYGMTQAELAESVGVRQATVSDWENGNQGVSRLAAIALSYLNARHLTPASGAKPGDGRDEELRAALAELLEHGVAPDTMGCQDPSPEHVRAWAKACEIVNRKPDAPATDNQEPNK